jgi:hypothetical protein
MSTEKNNIIVLLKKDRQARELVIKWILENEHDKKYKKCRKCEVIELSKSFRGRECNECYKKYQKEVYKLKNPDVKRHTKIRNEN